jgi:hypothetical protein
MIFKAASLRDISNVFHPKAFTAKQMEFYQPTSIARDGKEYEYHDNLFSYIAQSKNDMHILVFGHGGCGKSTELRVLAENLSTKNIPSIVIEALDDLSLNDFTYIDIFIKIIENLTKYAHNNSLALDKRILTAFYKALSTRIIKEYWEEDAVASIESGASASVTLPFFLQFFTKISASLRMGSGVKEELRQEIKPKMADLTEAVNSLIENINRLTKEKKGEGNIVIIIDGLEKCRQECVRKLFTDDVSSLKAIKTHLVIACPISLYRSPDAAILANNFDKADLMPMIKTHNLDSGYSPYDMGINVIKELILKRADASLLEEGTLEKIIYMGGGSLRDTFRILIDCSHEAYMRKKNAVDMSCVDFILNKEAADIFLRVEYKLFPVIKKIFDGDHRLRNEGNLEELLYAGAVFEYNGERWIDLHPLVRYHIAKNPGILD